MRSLLILLALVVALPTTARAEIAVPETVVPGEQVVVTAEPVLAGSQLRLSVDVPGGGSGRAAGGVVGLDGVARFQMPATFECTENCAGVRRFLPGERVEVSACSVPVVSGVPGLMTSSVFCAGAGTTVGGRVSAVLRGRAEPRRVGVLRRVRWTSWGTGTARARGTLDGRRATAVASGLVDCGGVATYSRLTIGSRLLRLPC